MNFTKMHGLGNDFIVVAAGEVPRGAAEMARRLCDRHFGIGADGLVFVLPSSAADIGMRIYNADGSEAEQCGNAVRCVGKYAFERGLVRSRELTVETGAGLQRIWLEGSGETVERVSVDMGAPVLRGPDIPVALDREPVVREPVEAGGRTFHFTAVSMGNPHAVIFLEEWDGVNVGETGPLIEGHPLFPRRVNVEFARVLGPGEVEMRVWERGCGETLACGTGACATVVAGVLEGRMRRKAVVHLRGGDLEIEWRPEGPVYMTGPAVEVFRGEIP